MRVRGALLVTFALTGCDLTEVTIVESEDVVVVEGLVQVDEGPWAGSGRDRVAVFLFGRSARTVARSRCRERPWS